LIEGNSFPLRFLVIFLAENKNNPFYTPFFSFISLFDERKKFFFCSCPTEIENLSGFNLFFDRKKWRKKKVFEFDFYFFPFFADQNFF
jgi:hypothetical protein